jgi:predicted methyltransferase
VLTVLPVTALAEADTDIDRAAANAIVAAPDRSKEDRARDARRRPDELLVFAQIGPGMTAVDLGAGDGYTTELLARAVGANGKVYGQNTPIAVEKYVKETWPARLAKPVNANVVRIDAPMEDPLPRTTRDVDVVTMIFTYHDTYLSRVGDFDHKRFLRRLYKAMRPGGRLIIVDHRAAPGAQGKEVADDLHRIDEQRVIDDFEQAGFVLDATADFMANAADPRTQPFFDMSTPTDAFVQRWVKPAN